MSSEFACISTNFEPCAVLVGHPVAGLDEPAVLHVLEKLLLSVWFRRHETSRPNHR